MSSFLSLGGLIKIRMPDWAKMNFWMQSCLLINTPKAHLSNCKQVSSHIKEQNQQLRNHCSAQSANSKHLVRDPNQLDSSRPVSLPPETNRATLSHLCSRQGIRKLTMRNSFWVRCWDWNGNLRLKSLSFGASTISSFSRSLSSFPIRQQPKFL